MRKLFLLFGFFWTHSLLVAQVGIGTITPDASSILDISETDKGILIPRVSLTAVTDTMLDGVNTAATGLLIYNTNAATTGGSGVGFYYFNGTTWERLITSATATDDIDWYEEGTTTSPDDITDDMYTQGNVAIGKTTADYPLDVYSITETIGIGLTLAASDNNNRMGYFNTISGTGTGALTSISNTISGCGTGNRYGMNTAFLGSGSSTKYGVYNNFDSSAIGEHYGVYNFVAGQGTAPHYGVFSNIQGNTDGDNYGTYNAMLGSGSGNHYGMYSLLSGSATGTLYGTYNDITNTSDGIHFGVYNRLTGSGSGTHYGNYSFLNPTGSGNQYGTFNNITSTQNGLYVGTYNYINSSGSGIQIGVTSLLQNNGTGERRGLSVSFSGTGVAPHYGALLSLGADGDGDQYGIRSAITNSGNGLHHGMYNTLTSSGTGWHIGVRNDISGNPATGNTDGIFNNISRNGSGIINGVRNDLTSVTSTGLKTGVANTISGSGSTKIGVSNSISGTATATQQGVSNSLSTSSDVIQYGVNNNVTAVSGNNSNTFGTNNTINGDGGGIFYGTYNSLSGAGTGNKYASYNIIAPGAGGTHFALYSEALKSGSYAGYFLGNVAIGTTPLNAYILPASRGTFNQIMQTDGTGNISWINPSAVTGDLWNQLGNAGTDGGTSNFIGTTDNVSLMVRTNNINRVRFTTGGHIETLNTNSSVFIGENAGLSNTGLGNVNVGYNAGAPNTIGQYNVYVGYEAGRLMTTQSNNTFVGSFAGYNTSGGELNTLIGSGAGSSITDGDSNTMLGVSAGQASDEGDHNIIIGRSSGLYNYDGNNNIYIGTEAGYGSLDATLSAALSNNVYLGYRSGRNASGSNNIFLGYQSGFSEAGSNKLYIENSSSASPLIYGEFDTNLLRINGTLNINNQFSFPNTDGTANQVMQTDGAGNVTWEDPSSIDATTASNGLSLATNDVRLGGSLIQNTTVTANAFDMAFNLNSVGAGNFLVQDGGVNKFAVINSGLILMGDDTYWRDANTGGTNIAILDDDGNDGRFRLLENGTTSVDLDANSQFVFNEQGLDRNFRVESDDETNMLFVDAGLDNVGIKTGTPTRNLQVSIDQFTGASYGGFSILQSFTGNEWTFYTSQSSDVLALYYNNNLRGSFDEVSGNYTPVSDQRLKKNIDDLEPVLDKIVKLKPKKYHFKNQSNTEEKSYGVIAQELETIFPEIVKQMGDDTNGEGITDLKTVSYTELIPVLIKGMQEQQFIIENQKAEIEQLRKDMAEIKALLNRN